MLKSYGSHSPWLDVGVAGASSDGKNHLTVKSAEVFVLSAVVPWALSNTEALQGVDQKAGGNQALLGKHPRSNHSQPSENKGRVNKPCTHGRVQKG
jgi:hypothetical protein